MITKAGTSNDIVNHFRGLKKDYDAGDHMPNSKGIMEVTGVKLKNGDELYLFDTKKVFMFDEENVAWLPQN